MHCFALFCIILLYLKNLVARLCIIRKSVVNILWLYYMNPFDNNRPNLSASEHMKDKRDKTIYQAAKQRFQSNTCSNNQNIKLYNNGKIKNVINHTFKNSLARGSVLCENCNNKGLLCGDVAEPNLQQVTMGNNNISEFWGGSFVRFEADGGKGTQHPGFVVFSADVSGTWGLVTDDDGVPTDVLKSTLADANGVVGPSNNIIAPYGYTTNLFSLPRNADGNGMVIDPSNILFPDELCEPFRYLKHSNITTFLVLRGAVPLIPSVVGDLSGQLFTPGQCTDASYNYVLGSYFVLAVDSSNNEAMVHGRIKSICCRGELELEWGNKNKADGSYPKKTVGIFDTYVELFAMENTAILSKLVNYTPQFTADKWDWGPHHAWRGLGSYGEEYGDVSWNTIGLPPGGADQTISGSYWFSSSTQSLKIIQGSGSTGRKISTGITNKHSYMSCLEDGTRKIAFASNKIPTTTLIKSFCSRDDDIHRGPDHKQGGTSS